MPQINARLKSLQRDLQEKRLEYFSTYKLENSFVPFSVLYSRLLFLQHLNPMKLVNFELGATKLHTFSVYC